MEFTQQFWEYLKTAGPEFGQPDDASVGFLDDESAVVTVQYILSEEQWDALEAQWEARSASGGDASHSSIGSAKPMTTEVTKRNEEGPFYLIKCGAVIMGDDDSPVEFDTVEEAERWANANLGDWWQIMEGKLRPSDVFRPQQATPDPVCPERQ